MAEGQRRTNRKKKKNTDKSTQILHLNHSLNSWNSIELSHLAHMPSTCGSVGEACRGRMALNNSGMQQSLKMGCSWGWIKRKIHGGVGRCRNLRSFTSCAIKGIIHPPTTEDLRSQVAVLRMQSYDQSWIQSQVVNQRLVGFSLNCVSIMFEAHSHLLETSRD